MRALIVENGQSRGALAAARGLADAGWTVGVGWPGGFSWAACSRYARRRHRVPPAGMGVDAFVTAVAAAVDAGGYGLVFGAGDAEVLALSHGRDRISARVPHAPHEQVTAAFDKLAMYRAAAAAGLGTPPVEEASPAALARLGGPVVVKARLHAPPGARSSSGRLEAAVARDRKEAEGLVAEMRSAGGQPLLQAHVEGRLMALVTVMDAGGEPRVTLQQLAERIWPVPAGVSVRARTVEVDEELAHRLAGLLRRLGWFGLAEAQFVVPPSGPPQLIDLNGRFYGSLALALGAGVNLPAIWAALAVGDDPGPLLASGRVGARYHWLEADLRRALVERREGLARDVVDCALYARNAHHSIWQVRDPVPAVAYAATLLRRAGAKMARSRSGGQEGSPVPSAR